MKYRSIFFDLDHTLWDFDTNAYHTLKELYEKYALDTHGIPVFDTFLARYKAINEEMWGGYGRGTVTKEDLRYKRFYRTLSEFGVDNENLSRSIGEDYVSLGPSRKTLFPFTTEVLEYLSEKYELFILTNGFEEVQHLKLQTCGIKDHFRDVITSERAGYKKPDKRMFDYAIQLSGAACSEVLMVGDSLEMDVGGARSCGIDQVYFNPAKLPHTEKVTFEIGCLSELKSIL